MNQTHPEKARSRDRAAELARVDDIAPGAKLRHAQTPDILSTSDLFRLPMKNEGNRNDEKHNNP